MEAADTLECRDLVVDFDVHTALGRRTVHAVKGVDVSLRKGRVLGIVGESGSGKSTLARALVGLQPPTTGSIRCGGIDVTDRSLGTRRKVGARIGMVFQDPRSSLNPRLSVRSVIGDPLVVQGMRSRGERRLHVEALLEDVGLPLGVASRPVRTLSGGQLQRVAIARALALDPDFLVADEPTSALDVSVQAQILNLLADLRTQREFGVLLISHDMRVMRFMCDDLLVMLDGVIVEQGEARALFASPTHSYTRSLILATPLLAGAGAQGWLRPESDARSHLPTPPKGPTWR